MQITKHKLSNGMSVLLCEKRNAPVISLNALVYAGSAIETNEEAGMCHVIEHMIFKGTPTRPVGAIARDIEAAGGEVNAYTSFDQTVFYINMASRFMDKGLEILADAIQHPLFDEKELERELEVICEEIRRGKDNPSHCISEDLFAHSFTRHTYGRPIIGFHDTVKSFDREKVLAFYKRHYNPRNMTFIAVGDFSTPEMLKKLEAEFSSFEQPSEPAPSITPEKEPCQDAIRINMNKMDVQSTHFMLGFHIPNIMDDDVPALDLLSHILGGAESSRFEQIIKEKKRLVHSIYSYAYTPKYPGIFVIGGMTQPEKTLKAIDAIWEEVQKVCAETVTADELNRAKINIRAGEIYERESVGGFAAKLAYFMAVTGDYDFEKRYFQILGDLTAEDLRLAAVKYLAPEKCTVEILSPKKAKENPTVDGIRAACSGRKHIATLKKVEKSRPKIQRLENGIRLIIQENHTLPTVAVYAVMPGGIRFETEANNGLSYMASHLITKGTVKRNAIEIAEKIESMAGIIDGFCGRNTMGVRTEFLSEKLHDGFGLFAEVLTTPSFDKKEFEKERSLQIEAIHNQEDSLHSMAFYYFLKQLYGKHPYGFRMLGEEASVKRLTVNALKQYWEKHLDPREMIISVVGDVSPSEIAKLTRDWVKIGKKGKLKEPVYNISRPSRILSKEVMKKEKEQSHIVLGFLGTKLRSQDHYRLSVLNHILGGQGGRLFITLRDRMSLAYSVNSTMQSGIEPGHFAVYIGTEAGKTETAIKGIKEELRKVSTDLVGKEELDRAKQYMVGTYELDQQKNRSLASSYAFNEFYGLGLAETDRYPQRILGVTREEILATAKKYIDLDAYILSVIRPK